MTPTRTILNQHRYFHLFLNSVGMKYSHDMQSDTITLEHLPTGAITVRPGPEGVVAIVGTDGVLTTVFTRPGRLEVRVDVGGRPLWLHTFEYTLAGVEHTSESGALDHVSPTPIQRRRPGRPRKAPLLGELGTSNGGV